MKKALILIQIVLIAAMAVFMVGLSGCATNQTATQQLMEQTDDPAIISLGTYADALEAYVQAQDLYLPYQQFMRAVHPEIDLQAKAYFKEARGVLKQWKDFGSVTAGQKTTFRNAIRQILIQAAMAAEKRGK